MLVAAAVAQIQIKEPRGKFRDCQLTCGAWRQTRQPGLGCASNRACPQIYRLPHVFCITAASITKRRRTFRPILYPASTLDVGSSYLSSFGRPAQEDYSRHNSHNTLFGFQGRELATRPRFTLNHNLSLKTHAESNVADLTTSAFFTSPSVINEGHGTCGRIIKEAKSIYR